MLLALRCKKVELEGPRLWRWQGMDANGCDLAAELYGVQGVAFVLRLVWHSPPVYYACEGSNWREAVKASRRAQTVRIVRVCASLEEVGRVLLNRMPDAYGRFAEVRDSLEQQTRAHLLEFVQRLQQGHEAKEPLGGLVSQEQGA